MYTNPLPDFDTLKDLAEHSPEQLDLLLKTNIELIYEQATERQLRRLKGLQFQIDAQRRLSKNPVDCCIRMSRMMHDSFFELNTALHNFPERY